MLLLTNLTWAQDLPKTGDIYGSLTYDLNGDGKPEKIGLSAFNIHGESESFWGRLRVTDAAGKLIWEAPKASDSGHRGDLRSIGGGIPDGNSRNQRPGPDRHLLDKKLGPAE